MTEIKNILINAFANYPMFLKHHDDNHPVVYLNLNLKLTMFDKIEKTIKGFLNELFFKSENNKKIDKVLISENFMCDELQFKIKNRIKDSNICIFPKKFFAHIISMPGFKVLENNVDYSNSYFVEVGTYYGVNFFFIEKDVNYILFFKDWICDLNNSSTFSNPSSFSTGMALPINNSFKLELIIDEELWKRKEKLKRL
jgi:hypothetical protein